MQETDRRVRRTRAALAQALLDLASERPFERLTVRELAERADVGERLISEAKRCSERSGKYVSQIVADFFAATDADEDIPGTEISSRVRSLRGAFRGSTVSVGCHAIVTRDATGFAKATMPVFQPLELLAAVAASAD